MSTLGSVWQEGALRGKVCLRFWKTVNTLQLLLSLGEHGSGEASVWQ